MRVRSTPWLNNAFPPLNGCHSLPCPCSSWLCLSIARPFCALPPRSSPSPMLFFAGLFHRATWLCFSLAILLFAMPFAKQSTPSYALALPCAALPSYAFAFLGSPCNAIALRCEAIPSQRLSELFLGESRLCRAKPQPSNTLPQPSHTKPLLNYAARCNTASRVSRCRPRLFSTGHPRFS